MNDNQNNNQFQNTSQPEKPASGNGGRVNVNQDLGQENGGVSDTTSSALSYRPATHSRVVVLIALAAVILVLGVVFLTLFSQTPAPTSLGVDKNGVLIINLNKKQVVERTTDVKPLNEPEVHAVFRWAVEHPDEAARLSPEEKANIIRSLNE